MSTTTKIILDTRRMKTRSGTFPVKLQVTHERKTQHYQTIFDLSEGDYAKLSATHLSEELKKIKSKLRDIEKSADDYISDTVFFSFYEFEREFVTNNELFKKRRKLKEPEASQQPDSFDYSPFYERFKIFEEDHSQPGCISFVYLKYIKQLLQEGRVGTALSYKDSYNSIKKFKGNVSFTQITTSFLNQYEQWMKKKGCSRTTVGIKLRPLRTIFNEASAMGIIKKDKCYPFGRRKYQIPTGRNIKKALAPDIIKQIYYHQPESINEEKARDFWLFCYFGNGMNPKDVVHLKYKDIQEGYIVFLRAKTERTTRNDPKPIMVYLTEDMQRIIDRWGNEHKTLENYVFPIMDDTLNPMEQYELVPVFTRFINDWMAKIADKLEIKKKITTIVSRHSFSTQLKRSGVSTEYIQEALGHTDKKTTENYLDSFDKDVKKDFASLLSSFKNPVESSTQI